MECNVGTALTIARHVTAYYYSKKIRPYLRYTEAVEIDETKIGAQIYKAATKCDEFRWVFGMICRKSRLSAMYFVSNRKASNLHRLIKKHCTPGVIVYSDDAAMYTVKHGGRS